MGFSKLLRLAAVSATLITQGTLTAQTPGLSHTVAWNNAAVTFIAQTLDVTDTASAAGSLLARWRVGGVDKFVVSKAGAVTAGAASFTTLAASSTAAITGNLTVGASTFVVTAATGEVATSATVNTDLTWSLTNLSVWTAARAKFALAGDVSTFAFFQFSSGYTTSGINIANSSMVYSNSAVGINFVTDNATAIQRFYTGSAVLALTLGATGAATFAGTLAITGALTGVTDFTASGRMVFGGTAVTGAAGTASIGGVTRTTIGANGAATALTANPVGYLDVYIAGTAMQVPYYTRGA